MAQSDMASTGRVVLRFEFVTVRARRQLSAMHPGGARRSRKRFADAKLARARMMERNFMATQTLRQKLRE